VQGWLLELMARHPELRPAGAVSGGAFGGPDWPEGGVGGAAAPRRRLHLNVSITGHSLVGAPRPGAAFAAAGRRLLASLLHGAAAARGARAVRSSAAEPAAACAKAARPPFPTPCRPCLPLSPPPPPQGGLIAECATIESTRFADAYGMAWRCVSFESPGVPQCYHQAALRMRPEPGAWDRAITSYLAAPNPINMLYPHLGARSRKE
jgi:hypothetical protein